MEKLIELLNDWDGRNVKYNKQSDGGYMFWLGDLAFREERMCGKKFGFIKRLVGNNKVKELRPIEEERIYTQEELLLMQLAIQDEPIRFLCEILK